MGWGGVGSELPHENDSRCSSSRLDGRDCPFLSDLRLFRTENQYIFFLLTMKVLFQPRPQGFSLKWVGREKALASAGHVHSLNIPEKLIYMQPAGFALTEVERSNNGK